MFKNITTLSDLPFIVHSDIGYMSHTQSIRYNLLEFNEKHYNDDLFNYFNIPFPDMLNTAVKKRRAEYLAVRYAAKQLLQDSGVFSVPRTGPDRSPVWPSGWCGSLSHTDAFAIALVAPSDSCLSPGIDIEKINIRDIKEISDEFTTKKEQVLLMNSNINYETALTIVFSAKETLFKCLYPKLKLFMDFNVVSVNEIQEENNYIIFEFTKTIHPQYIKGSFIYVEYIILEDKVITFST
ncbi:4'-phosphopantetheinyl transferase family protein [Klebsiella michiganensis]|uniref:4'-phosphopantetheinyl transferase family protein n=1 Tax=Klebsiella michiganensis TaxID=1134687 RepID=UPI003F509AF1